MSAFIPPKSISGSASPATAPEAPPTESQDSAFSAFDPRAIFDFVRSYAWILAGTTLICATLALFWSIRQTKQYEAVTTLEYDPSPRSPLGDEVQDVAQPFSSFWLTQEFYETQNRIISSRRVLERVVRAMSLHKHTDILLPKMRKKLEREGATEDDLISHVSDMLKARVSVRPVKDTRMVHVAVRDSSRKRAADIANRIASLYLEKTIEDRLGVTRDALDWLRGQEETLRKKLEDSELDLHLFKKKAKVLSVSLEDRQNVVANEIETYSNKLTDAKSKRIELEALVAELRNLRGDDLVRAHNSAIDGHPEVAELRARFREKLSEKSSLEKKYGSAHPKLASLQASLEGTREELNDAIAGLIGNVTSDLRAAQNVERKLKAELSRAQNAGLDLNLHQIEYERLNRTRENSAKLYEILLQRSTETNLTKLLKVAYAQVVDTALVPKIPVYPNVPLFVLLGALVGLLLGAGVAFLTSKMDSSVRGESDVENLGVTVLGSLPPLDTEQKKKGGWLPAPIAARLSRKKQDEQIPGTHDLEIFANPTGTAAEACRTLRTNLTFMAAERPLNSLLVTSTVPKEGKTTTAVSLAITHAQNGKRVVIVDTDMRRPRVHRTFGLNLDRGVSTFLVQQGDIDSIVFDTEIENLSVIPCGPIPPNASELLHTPRFAELVAQLEERYDRVIFDSPPLGAVTDAAVIGKQTDGTLLVSRLNSTHRNALAHTIKRLRYIGVNLVGCVVNYVDSAGNTKYSNAYNRSYYAYQYSYRPEAGATSS